MVARVPELLDPLRIAIQHLAVFEVAVRADPLDQRVKAALHLPLAVRREVHADQALNRLLKLHVAQIIGNRGASSGSGG